MIDDVYGDDSPLTRRRVIFFSLAGEGVLFLFCFFISILIDSLIQMHVFVVTNIPQGRFYIYLILF